MRADSERNSSDRSPAPHRPEAGATERGGSPTDVAGSANTTGESRPGADTNDSPSGGSGTSGTGVPPVRGVTSFTRTRRNLPHWQEPGSVYWLTWKTAGTNLSPAERTVVLDAILYWDDKKWIVYCAVVMPDHVHVLAQPTAIEGADPRACHELAEIMQSVKSFSAHEINKSRNRRGAIWQDERSDRIIRDEYEFWQKWQYARDNPVKQGLAESAEQYPWFYQRTGLQPPHRRDAGATGATQRW